MAGKDHLFKKGYPPLPGAGRPKESTQQKWYDLKWWYKLITDNVEALNEVQKVELGLKGLALLVSKLPAIPATPSESAQRVEDARGILDAASATPRIGSQSSVGDSVSKIQTGTETKTSL